MPTHDGFITAVELMTVIDEHKKSLPDIDDEHPAELYFDEEA